MSLRTSATRYAKVLLQVAAQESDPAQIERDLTTVVTAMREHGELQRVLTSPAIAAETRARVVSAIAERAAVATPVARLLRLLAERGRMDLLPDLLEVYRERLLAHRNTVRATVTSAAPLTPHTLDALATSLGRMTGKTVHIEAAVDPALIGGVVTQVGSTVYDGSIRTQLQKMKQQLIETA